MTYQKHFDVTLTQDSEYFALNKLTKCVEKNADKDLLNFQMVEAYKKYCSQLRLKAFDSMLFYHYISKGLFLHEHSVKYNISPY